MLPLEGILFVPSLIVTPIAVAVLIFLRRREGYPWLWRRAVVVCIVLSLLFAMQILNAPLYSERDHSPANPGGPSSGVVAVIGVYLLWTCAIIPTYPILVALACLAPGGWGPHSRLLLVALSLIYVGVFAWLFAQKNERFIADFQQARIQERAQHIQQRELMRQRYNPD
jgi:glucan phosphoethanolaminetransferase (alkaline phosphatase superfamily)